MKLVPSFFDRTRDLPLGDSVVLLYCDNAERKRCLYQIGMATKHRAVTGWIVDIWWTNTA